jgi:hypothetical protein
LLVRNVNADLAHDLDGERMQALGDNASAHHLEALTGKVC